MTLPRDVYSDMGAFWAGPDPVDTVASKSAKQDYLVNQMLQQQSQYEQQSRYQQWIASERFEDAAAAALATLQAGPNFQAFSDELRESMGPTLDGWMKSTGADVEAARVRTQGFIDDYELSAMEIVDTMWQGSMAHQQKYMEMADPKKLQNLTMSGINEAFIEHQKGTAQALQAGGVSGKILAQRGMAGLEMLLNTAAAQTAESVGLSMEMQRYGADMGKDIEQHTGTAALGVKETEVGKRTHAEETFAGLGSKNLQYGIQGLADMQETRLKALGMGQDKAGQIAEWQLGTAERLNELNQPIQPNFDMLSKASELYSPFAPMKSTARKAPPGSSIGLGKQPISLLAKTGNFTGLNAALGSG